MDILSTDELGLVVSDERRLARVYSYLLCPLFEALMGNGLE